MVRILVFTYFIAFLAAPSLFAQKKGWAPGYVVTIQGDTFRGTIKYGNNILSDAKYDACHIIKFKNARGILINFTPQFTRCYQRGTDFFLSYKAQLAGETWNVFIKKITTGPMDLYYYYGERKSFMYFMKKPNADFLIVESDDTAFTFNRLKVKSALLKYFKECNAVVKKIDDGTYRIYNLRLKDIPAMVAEYNGCK